MSSSSAHIRRTGLADLGSVAGRFDTYRRFYRQGAHLEGVLRFIRTRMVNEDSEILLAEAKGDRPALFNSSLLIPLCKWDH